MKNGKDIEWGYIVEFFNMDSRNSVRMAPKLTPAHIKLTGFSKMRVKYATQVLSHSVAAGISTMVTLKALPPEASETALFIERIDQLFNTFNSRLKSSNQKMRHAMSETSGHRQFLEDTLEWMSTLHSRSSKPLPSISGWKIAIRSLLLLFADLVDEYHVKFLSTNRLNQDCIENLFSVIRGKMRNGDNPSPKQFRQFLRQVMVDSILTQSDISNCEEYGDYFLFTLNNLQSQGRQEVTVAGPRRLPTQPPANVDSDLTALVFNLPAEDLSREKETVITYMTGYIVRKVRPHVCQECAQVLHGQLEGTTKEMLLTNKQYPDLQGPGLVVPSAHVVNVIEQCEKVYKQSEQLLHMNNVRVSFLSRLSREAINLVCPSKNPSCNLAGRIVTLYLNIRLNFTLKENNRHFAATSARKNRKLCKIQHM